MLFCVIVVHAMPCGTDGGSLSGDGDGDGVGVGDGVGDGVGVGVGVGVGLGVGDGVPPNSSAPASGAPLRALPSASVTGASLGSAASIATEVDFRWKSPAAGLTQPNGAVCDEELEDGLTALPDPPQVS